MSKLKYFIWVDKEMPTPRYAVNVADRIIVCKTYHRAIHAIKEYSSSIVCIDLGYKLEDSDKTCLDIAKFIVDKKIPLYYFNCHSSATIINNLIEDLLLRNGYKEFYYA